MNDPFSLNFFPFIQTVPQTVPSPSESPLLSEGLDESNVIGNHCDSPVVVRHGVSSLGQHLGRQINQGRDVIQRLVRDVPLVGRSHCQTGRHVLSPQLEPPGKASVLSGNDGDGVCDDPHDDASGMSTGDIHTPSATKVG